MGQKVKAGREAESLLRLCANQCIEVLTEVPMDRVKLGLEAQLSGKDCGAYLEFVGMAIKVCKELLMRDEGQPVAEWHGSTSKQLAQFDKKLLGEE